MLGKITSGKIHSNDGSSFSAFEINSNGLVVLNAADEYDSSGNLVSAGSEEVISVDPTTGTSINANYIKTGVIDANLLRAGLIQTVPSWNTKWYGAPEDSALVQIGFTGGSVVASSVATGAGTVSITLPSGHGLVTGNHVRVSGLYFTSGTLLGGVGLNLPTDGPVDYAAITMSGDVMTYTKSDITAGLTASTDSIVFIGRAHAVTSVVRTFDGPPNLAELSTVVVTTSTAHSLAVGDYIELANVFATIDGVAYVTAVTSTTFTFEQRFGEDIDVDLAASDLTLPNLLAPVAIQVTKGYQQRADGSVVVSDLAVIGLDQALFGSNTNTGKLVLRPDGTQTGSTIFLDGTLTKTGSFTTTRVTGGTVTVTLTGTSPTTTGILVGMFVTTASATSTLVATNAKVATVTATQFTYSLASGTTASGTTTSAVFRKTLSFVGGGLTRFQQTISDAGAIGTGSLILGDNAGLNNIGTALLVIPADGELVFNNVVPTPKYVGGGNLFQSATNVLKTSGAFTVGGTLTATTISATNYGLVAADIPTLALGTDTSGNYVSTITSANSLISVSGSGAETAAVTITADTTPTFTGVTTTSLNVSGVADFTNDVDLGNDASDEIKATSLFGTTDITNSQTLRVYTLGNTSPSRIQWRIFRETSSERFKVNIIPMLDSEEILEIQPSLYYDKIQYETNPNTATLSYGLIAEQMEKNPIGSKFVSHNEDGLPETVQYDKLVVPLLSAMRALRSRINELEDRLAALEGA